MLCIFHLRVVLFLNFGPFVFFAVKELRDTCRRFKLKITGNKDVLVVRLAAFLISYDKNKRIEREKEAGMSPQHFTPAFLAAFAPLL